MIIDRVTITGADDSTDIQWMSEIQKQYPFVEWGILVSQNQIGNYRFPSPCWLEQLLEIQHQLKTSIHVCGRWVREICTGNWSHLIRSVGPNMKKAQRIQLNFHQYVHKIDQQFFKSAHIEIQNNNWQLIFQIDGVNDELLTQARLNNLNAVPLYDLSSGAGILPLEWPQQSDGIYTGYAGGLGPQNVLDQINRIKNVANGHIWIDMETRVRTDDDSKLDEELVESVLEQCSKMDCLTKLNLKE